MSQDKKEEVEISDEEQESGSDQEKPEEKVDNRWVMEVCGPMHFG